MPFKEFAFGAENEQSFPEKTKVESVKENEERIEGGVWKPSIFDDFKDVLGVGASTKELKRLISGEEAKIRITASLERFDKRFSQEDKEIRIAKLGAGRILVNFLEKIAPGVNVHNIEKTSLEHSDRIIVVNQQYLQQDKGKRARIKADGLITNIRKKPLMVVAADCAPVGIYDPKNKATGVFHSGWQGTLKQISSKGVREMGNTYGSKPEELLIVIGPYAGGEEFEVSEKEYKRFQEAKDENGCLIYSEEDIQSFFKKNEKKQGHYFLDTGQAIRKSLIRVGVLEKNIQVSEYSTMSKKGNLSFSSERIEGNKDRDSFVFMMVCK